MIILATSVIYGTEYDHAKRLDGIQYCHGEYDFEGMGIACVCAYDYSENRYRVFLGDNINELQELINHRRLVIGFDNHRHDDQLLAAHGITLAVGRSYDLQAEIWAAVGLSPHVIDPERQLYSLDAMALANLGHGKSGCSTMAPILWQRGQFGEVIDSCLEDVSLIKHLMARLFTTSALVDPRSHGTAGRIWMRSPSTLMEPLA